MQRLLTILILFFIITAHLTLEAQVDFTASVTEGCTPLKVKFTIDPATIDFDTVESVIWNFGFGEDTLVTNPDTVTYASAGTYSVRLIINQNRPGSLIKADLITVHQTVSATFNWEEYASNFNYRFIPLDEILVPGVNYTYIWEYVETTGPDDRTTVLSGINTMNQLIAIDSITLDTGLYRVTLTIMDIDHGCTSQSMRLVSISEEVVLPNVFVYGSGRYFIVDPRDLNTVLHFQVFNRNGVKVFEQTAPVITWNGESSWGRQLNTGVYFYILEAKEGDPQSRYTQNGFIHLYPGN
jgi:PKD repeat protein